MIRLGLRWVRESTGKGVARLPVGMETRERGCQERETGLHQTFCGSDKVQVCGLLNYLREWIPVEEDVKRGKGNYIKLLVDRRKNR